MRAKTGIQTAGPRSARAEIALAAILLVVLHGGAGAQVHQAIGVGHSFPTIGGNKFQARNYGGVVLARHLYVPSGQLYVAKAQVTSNINHLKQWKTTDLRAEVRDNIPTGQNPVPAATLMVTVKVGASTILIAEPASHVLMSYTSGPVSLFPADITWSMVLDPTSASITLKGNARVTTTFTLRLSTGPQASAPFGGTGRGARIEGNMNIYGYTASLSKVPGTDGEIQQAVLKHPDEKLLMNGANAIGVLQFPVNGRTFHGNAVYEFTPRSLIVKLSYDEPQLYGPPVTHDYTLVEANPAAATPYQLLPPPNGWPSWADAE